MSSRPYFGSWLQRIYIEQVLHTQLLSVIYCLLNGHVSAFINFGRRSTSYGCIVLCCTALCCIVLYCIVLCCIVLYCIVLYCIVLYCIVLYCIVLFLFINS